MGLVRAHIDLAKAEMSGIAGEIGRLAALGALALGLVFAAALLATIGTALFLGEWLFGSLGWGVLHGVVAFVSVAMAAVLVAIGMAPVRIGRLLLVAAVVAVVLGVALGLDLPNLLYTRLGDASGAAIDPGTRPLVFGVVIGGLIGLLAGIAAALMMGAAGGARFAALAGLVVLGVAIGAITAITFGPRVGAGIGIAVGFVTWMVLMGIDVARTGINMDALKKRFYPAETIETSKETLEWLQKRMPPGIGS